jgi:hypothetical protein
LSWQEEDFELKNIQMFTKSSFTGKRSNSHTIYNRTIQSNKNQRRKDYSQTNSGYDFSQVPLFPVQTKLEVNKPGDKYEQEADRMAEKVMRMPDSKFIQRKCEKCEEEEKNKIQRKGAFSVPSVTPSFQNQLHHSQNEGQPLPATTNRFMSTAFGTDLSRVRIHDNDTSHQLNQNIHAKAFTYGSNIYFNKGQYNPDSSGGRKLLAHELTHTIQQRPEIRRQPGNPFGAPPIDYAVIQDPLERKLQMETDAKVIMWKDALKRLKNGELTNEDLKNDRLMNRMTGLKSTEVTDLIKKIKKFQKKKDEERAAASEEDRKKMKEVKTDKIIEWLKVRKVISTPMGDKAKVSYNALNEVENYKIALKDVNITVKKDTSGATGNKTNVKTNFKGRLKWSISGGKVANLKKDGSAFNPTSLEVEIFTKYHDSPDATSAYGKGTTQEDKDEKTTTLRVHEGQHGTDYINYLTNNPLPVAISGGINGKLTSAQLKELMKYISKIHEESCELTDQSGLSQDEFLKTEEGKASGMKSCRLP